jgi:hypothetical protein
LIPTRCSLCSNIIPSEVASRLPRLEATLSLLTKDRPVCDSPTLGLPQEVLGSPLHGALVSALLAAGHSGGSRCGSMLLLVLLLLLLVAPPHAATATVGFVVATAVQVTALVHYG